jgi:hypothetical protein
LERLEDWPSRALDWSTLIERLIGIALGAAAPLLALALRRTRRHVLRDQVETYTNLATLLEGHDDESAREMRTLVADTARVLIAAERTALERRFDPFSLAALILVVVPTGALAIWAWGRPEWWHWPLVTVCVIWTVVWGIVGLTQLWTSSDQAEARQSTP